MKSAMLALALLFGLTVSSFTLLSTPAQATELTNPNQANQGGGAG